jgi:hypothetical protein
VAYGEQAGTGFGKEGLLRIVKNGHKKVSFFYQKIHKILRLVSPIPKLLFLAGILIRLSGSLVIAYESEWQVFEPFNCFH